MQGNGKHIGERVRFGNFEVDLVSSEIYRDGQRIQVQEQPFRILAMLLERPGEMVTREALGRALWPGDTFVDFEAGLNTAMRKLRSALADDAEQPAYIETLPRRGLPQSWWTGTTPCMLTLQQQHALPQKMLRRTFSC